MDETTIKVTAMIQARLQMQLLSLIAVLSHPIPGVSVGEQWSKIYLSMENKMSDLGQSGLKQIRLMAELVGSPPPETHRAAEILRELLVLDQLVLAGLADLWNVPPRSE